MESSDVITALRAVLQRWRKVGENLDAALSRLRGWLTDDFEICGLNNIPGGAFNRFSQPLVMEALAKVLVYDSAGPEIPYMATLRRADGGQWRLQSLKFQCIGCFGSGIDSQSNPCELCGATGWGVQ